jgi:hypothetical protein
VDRAIGARSRRSTIALSRTLKSAGVIFTPENGGEPGVKLRRPE